MAFGNTLKEFGILNPPVNKMTILNLNTIERLLSTQEKLSVSGLTLPMISQHQRSWADTFGECASG